MKVLLVQPAVKKNREPSVTPLGILSIATHLNNNNHVVRVSDRTLKAKKFKKLIDEFKPDIIGVSVITSKAIDDAVMVSKIAKEKKIYVCWGNTLASVLAEIVLKEDFVDFVSIGEGEFTWSELLNALENHNPLSAVDGLAFKVNGNIIINNPREAADPGDLPIINWDFVELAEYFRCNHSCKRMAWIYSGKGCPGECTFCFNANFHKRKYRKRPIENVMAEIESAVKKHGADGIFFGDELWCSSKQEMTEICDNMVALELDFVWGCQTRVGILSRDDYAYMYKCGCRWILFGIESGSKEMLKRIKKGINYEMITETIAACASAGIVSLTTFILGFPDESEYDLKQTIELIKKVLPFSTIVPYIFLPQLGTKIYNDLVDAGRIKPVENLNSLGYYAWDEFNANYSDVSMRELKVIRACSLWWSIQERAINPEKKRGYNSHVSVIVNTVKNVSQNGLRFLIRNASFTAYKYASILFNIVFFPKIRKKYNLYLDK